MVIKNDVFIENICGYLVYVQTALHLAVLTDQADIVGRLLDGGASSDVLDARGQTCVHVAVFLGTTSCLRQLLKHSRHPPNINAVSDDGLFVFFYIITVTVIKIKYILAFCRKVRIFTVGSRNVTGFIRIRLCLRSLYKNCDFGC